MTTLQTHPLYSTLNRRGNDCSTWKTRGVFVGLGDIEISECEKLRGVKLDWNFDDHISDICKKASGKLNALARIALLCEKRILMNDFFNSQFNHCFFIYMCNSRTNNRRINRFNET